MSVPICSALAFSLSLSLFLSGMIFLVLLLVAFTLASFPSSAQHAAKYLHCFARAHFARIYLFTYVIMCAMLCNGIAYVHQHTSTMSSPLMMNAEIFSACLDAHRILTITRLLSYCFFFFWQNLSRIRGICAI